MEMLGRGGGVLGTRCQGVCAGEGVSGSGACDGVLGKVLAALKMVVTKFTVNQ